MLSDEEKKAVDELKKEINNPVEVPTDKFNTFILYNIESARTILNLIEKQSKEIEELKAKIFDVIENSIDTYIEKSKPYWEQIMTKDKMTIEEALTIIDDMYQDRYKIMSQETEKETIVDLSKMDYIKFTNLEWASVRVLREVQSLNHKFKKLEDKIKAKIEELENQKRQWIEDRDNIKGCTR